MMLADRLACSYTAGQQHSSQLLQPNADIWRASPAWQLQHFDTSLHSLLSCNQAAHTRLLASSHSLLQMDDKMEMIAGMRPKSEKARAIKVTNVERWAASQTVHLRKSVRSQPLAQLALTCDLHLGINVAPCCTPSQPSGQENSFTQHCGRQGVE